MCYGGETKSSGEEEEEGGEEEEEAHFRSIFSVFQQVIKIEPDGIFTFCKLHSVLAIDTNAYTKYG